jgi:hypothetical protein
MSRSFQGSLELPVQSKIVQKLGRDIFKDLHINPTALPLLDRELGYHPMSPAVREGGLEPRAGWDGEYGPFLEYHTDGPSKAQSLCVNYADIRRVDYVTNSRLGRFDASILRPLTVEECIERMACFRVCLEKVAGPREPREDDGYWLVNVDRIGDWAATPSSGFGARVLPRMMRPAELARAQPALRGSGFLFVVVTFPSDDAEATTAEAQRVSFPVTDPEYLKHAREVGWARRRIPCRRVWICQVGIGEDGRRRAIATSWEGSQPPAVLLWG